MAGFAGLVPSVTACLTVDSFTASVYGAACRIFCTALVPGSYLFGVGLREECIYAVFWENTSGYARFSASWFDSGYMLLPVYVVVGTVSVYSAMLGPQ